LVAEAVAAEAVSGGRSARGTEARSEIVHHCLAKLTESDRRTSGKRLQRLDIYERGVGTTRQLGLAATGCAACPKSS
jgi:hypothetical protein